MANYVYIDEERTERLYAYDDNIMQYKSIRCYCKNPMCDAKMFIYNPEHPNRAFFKASGNPKHKGACGISSYQNYSREDYDEEAFAFPNGLLHLLEPVNRAARAENVINRNMNEVESIRPLSGLKETYAMLTNMEINDRYNNILISNMIADERTIDIYINKITGYKVVECNFYKYSDESQLILMNYPVFPNTVRNLELWFNNKDLYEKIKPRIKGKNHDGLVVVFGEWVYNENDNINYTVITSEKQIAVIRKES